MLSNYDFATETISKILRKRKYHPYKVYLMHKLSKDYFSKELNSGSRDLECTMNI